MLRRHWTFFLALLPLLGWWTYGLFDLDEGFYAAIAAEMNRRGEWITPFYNGKPWFEKPILIYWLLKPSLWLFGDMIGPRVPSILATVGLYAVCAWFAKRHLSENAAKWTPIVLGSSLLVIGSGRMALTDPLLNLSLAAAMLTFWESLIGEKKWRVVSAACLGLGVLSKGPIAGFLFLVPALWTYWKQPGLRPAFRGYWLPGIAVFVLVVASWYLPCWLINRETFVQRFLIEQNIERFRGGDAAHTRPLFPFAWSFYFIMLAVGFAPWWWYIRRSWKAESPVASFLKAWALTVFVFFTFSGAKLPHYILPAIPPLGLLVAAHLGAIEPKPKKAVAGLVAAAVFANAAFLGYYFGIPGMSVPGFHAEVHRLARYVRANASAEDEVAVYKMPKEKAFKGKEGLRLDETSHPSLLLYLDRSVLDTKEWAKVLASERPTWIITRWNRVRDEEIAAAGGRLKPVDPFPPSLYRLWKLEPRTNGMNPSGVDSPDVRSRD